MLESAIMALGEDFGSLQDKYTAIGLRRSSIKLARGKDHFLVRLDKIIDWQGFTPKLVEAYKGKACRSESPPRLHNDPLILFKMLLLAHLLNTSERAIEEQCHWYIPVRLFVGLGIYDAVPDHSTLTLFKRRLQNHDGIGDFKAIFDGIIRQALAKGVKFGSIQIVDAVHTVANVNNGKDRERHEDGRPSADPDATVVHKGKRLVTKANGVVEQQELMHLGYKTHVSQDAETGIVTSIKPTTGSSADNKQMADLIDNDTKLEVPAHTYTANKAYDDGDLHTKLQSEGRHPAMILKDVRTQKKNPNKAPWEKMLRDPFYQAGVRVRYRIERTFGEAKLWHRLGLARDRGLLNFKIQSYMTFMSINLKRIVWLLTGGRLRAIKPTRVARSAGQVGKRGKQGHQGAIQTESCVSPVRQAPNPSQLTPLPPPANKTPTL
jgi:IS5 family transposase